MSRARDQHGNAFVVINRNPKVLALVDRTLDPAINVFESGLSLVYLADITARRVPGLSVSLAV